MLWDVSAELLSFRKHLVQFMLSQHRAQRRLSEHVRGGKVVLHLNDGSFGIDHVEYSTASTFIETLSCEITSWVGISMTWMRKSTRTISWTKGINSTRPGPLTF